MKKFYLVSLLGIAACSKPDLSRTELLCGQSWKMESMTTNLPAATGFSIIALSYNDLPSCRKDNTYRFERDGRYVFDDGSEPCIATSQTGTGTWQWLNNETQLTTSLGGVSVTYDVVELKANQVRLDETYTWNGTDHHWRIYTPR